MVLTSKSDAEAYRESTDCEYVIDRGSSYD